MNQQQATTNNQEFSLSCIVPAHNEAPGIQSFLSQLIDKLQQHSKNIQIIVIDDGSNDNTPEKIKELAQPAIQLISFTRRFGKENAIAAGLKQANADATIIIDADFQHPLETIDTFIEKWQAGIAMVYGVPHNRQHEGPIKRRITSCFYRILNAASKIDIPANAGDFRLLDRQVVATLNRITERTRFMKGLYAWTGFKSCAVPYQVAQRAHGQSRWRIRQLTSLAITGLISFSDVPLRAWGLLGLSISLISFISAGYIVADTIIYGADVPGYATILVAIIFFGGIQLLSIGILGEYIARIFQEVKARPAYVVREPIATTATVAQPEVTTEHVTTK